jgi:glycosyltransferase involved in cell wall biosynthesis
MVTSHGTDLLGLRSRPMQVIKQFVARRASVITVVSEVMRDDVVRLGVNEKNVLVRPMGVDLTGTFSRDASVERSNDEVLFVGRLIDSKGLRFLLQAMPAVIRSRPEVFLTIVGDGPCAEEYRALATALGIDEKVTFVGAVPQSRLPEFFRRAACFVAPSLQEGLGLVVVEALGCGCPALVSDLPSMCDIAGQGNMAQLTRVPAGDVDALASALVPLLASPPSPMTDEQRARMMDRFDWKAVTDGYARLLCGLARC